MNLKTSQIVAKSITRLFFLLSLIAGVSYYFSPLAKDPRLKNTYFVISNKYLLIFPGILVVGFATLLIVCIRNKYNKMDLNWLLVVNTAVLMTVCLTLFLRIYSVVK
jgi:hypothetical protein